MKRTLFITLFLSIFSFNSTVSADVKVVTSIKPIHSLAAYVMDGVGKPNVIVDGYNSPHGFSLKPSHAKMIENADLIIWVGEDLEAFLEKPLDSIAKKATKVELMDLKGIKKLKFREKNIFEGHDDHGHKEDKHDDHGHKEEKHDDHGHKKEKHDDHGEHDHVPRRHDRALLQKQVAGRAGRHGGGGCRPGRGHRPTEHSDRTWRSMDGAVDTNDEGLLQRTDQGIPLGRSESHRRARCRRRHLQGHGAWRSRPPLPARERELDGS